MSTAATIALQQYKKVGVQTGVTDASPHRLIQMLLEGILDKIAFAKGNIERKEIAKKGENIGTAISIINTLQASLDMQKGGDIAQNLSALYDYIARILFDANINSDVSKLDEATSLLIDIKSAWDAIPEEFKTSTSISEQ